MKSTKFVLSAIGVVGLLIAALASKFTGELGLAVSAITTAYVTGNAVITRAALANGKDPNHV